MQAQSIGVRGIPFFLLDDKYAVSGAQSPETFLQALNQRAEKQFCTLVRQNNFKNVQST